MLICCPPRLYQVGTVFSLQNVAKRETEAQVLRVSGGKKSSSEMGIPWGEGTGPQEQEKGKVGRHQDAQDPGTSGLPGAQDCE